MAYSKREIGPAISIDKVQKSHYQEEGNTMKKLLASVVLSASMFVLPQLAAAGVILNERSEFSFTTPNSCTGEFVSIQGVQHVQFTPPDQAHGAHFRLNSNGTGLGLDSGASYVFNDTLQQGITYPSEGGLVQTITRFIRLTSLGAAPDDSLKLTTVITVDANGNVSVEGTVDAVCRGA